MRTSFVPSPTSPRRSGPPTQTRRLGIRGNHGWGLTAVLGMSDLVQVASRVEGKPTVAYEFGQYASFAGGAVPAPRNVELDLANPEVSAAFDPVGTSGTHVRVKIDGPREDNLLGNTLVHFTLDKFVNLLRMYTPIGQVNDYVLHPAYHCVRKADLKVSLLVRSPTDDTPRSVDFDTFRLSEHPAGYACQPFDVFVNSAMPQRVSVHTVHRTKSGGAVYLSGAEVQDSDVVKEIEKALKAADNLPGLIDSNAEPSAVIPRGFQLALSGGMRSEYLAREPKGYTAQFRGFVLAETAKPTLGRKHVVDQRGAIAFAAKRHEQDKIYDTVRGRVVIHKVPPTVNPGVYRWKRDQFTSILQALKQDTPPPPDLRVWAGAGSREAKVMMLYAELLGRQELGDIRILRANHGDRYDFHFLYRADYGAGATRPSIALADTLSAEGYGVYDRRLRRYHAYGVGEFKYDGNAVFVDFNPSAPSKSAETIDLLVCWEFDADKLAEKDWSTEDATDLNADFPGQTYLWKPSQSAAITRTRPLPVVALRVLVDRLVANGRLAAPLSQPNWAKELPDVYY